MANSQPTERQNDIQFRQLLEEAVSKPGTLMKAYSLFWTSTGNTSRASATLATMRNARGSFISVADVGSPLKSGH